MPLISERKQLIRDVELWVALTILEDDEVDVEEALLVYALLLDSRYLSRGHHQERDDHFFNTKFLKLTDSQFRAYFRTTREGFGAVTALIEKHPVFHNNSNYKQVHPGWQLLVALHRFGHYGNRINAEEVACDFCLGTGSVTLYTNRVITALLSLAPEWIRWPDEGRREEIGQVMREEGFPGCIGFIDRTTIPLSQKPALQGASYYDRKKRYCTYVSQTDDRKSIKF